MGLGNHRDATGDMGVTLTRERLRYGIVGTGALGGLYGARLARKGYSVAFLTRRDGEVLRSRGLTIRDSTGEWTLPNVAAYDRVEEMPPVDVAIVALKTTQNHLLETLLPPLLGSTGIALMLQNGLDVEAQAATVLGRDRVVGGVCFLCATKVAPGLIHHIDYGKIILGDYGKGYGPRGITERLRRIAQDFEAADLEIELCEDLLLARWRKLAWNVPFNGLSVVLDAATDELMADGAARSLIDVLMLEVAQGAASCGRELTAAFLAELMALTETMPPYKTSMKLDFDARRPLEVEAIVGAPLRMAAARGVALPQMEMLYRQLKFLDARNGGAVIQ
ncbi:MAG: putative 2-dehydropantoate 2-reductase [Cyanophyceae cyanobacterium]